MRVPLSWLNDLTPLAPETTPEQVHNALVRVGFEEEDLHRFEVTGPVVVGEVLSREPEEHSNGKTVNWCQVRVAPEGQKAADGGEDVRGVVCGAHNFEVGDRVIVTLPGAVLPGNFAIAARKTYGHVSDGMIASKRELGLGDEHSGIIVLSNLGLNPEVGTPAAEALGLNDTAVEINVTPDRGYAFSVRGIAREYTHATGSEFVDPALDLDRRGEAAAAQATATFPVDFADQSPIRGRDGVSGFIVRRVDGVDQSRPTPQWMVTRLLLAGQRTTGLASDISNYVMLELGNPLHAYDAEKVNGGITVRRANKGETLVTLDGQERQLHPEDLVIADDSGAIGIAGVMGGESTKTDDKTTSVLIEAATFDPVSIARSARRHKLPSEAAKRFERGVDPLVARAAAQRMVDLLVEYGGGVAAPIVADRLAEPAPKTVQLPFDYTAKLIGVDYSRDEVVETLQLIGCEVAEAESGFRVTVPSWRSDLSRPADLAEEIARLLGYDRIPSRLPVAPPGRGLTREQRLRRRAANHVTANGLTEVQNYPFVSQEQLDLFAGAKKAPGVKIANPLDGTVPFLRTSLLPGLLACAQRNWSRGNTNLALVEFGAVFTPAEPGKTIGTELLPPLGVKPADEIIAELNAAIPKQPLHAAALLIGDAQQKHPFAAQRSYDWADTIAAAEDLAASVSAELSVRQGSHPAFHPGRCAELFIGDQTVGYAGELLPEYTTTLHLPGVVAAYEVNLELVIELANRSAKTAQLSTYPAATQDLTLLAEVETPISELTEAVAAGSGELLERITLVDDYRGQGVPEGKRAVTFSLLFRAQDRTLKAQEATAAKLAGAAVATERFGATVRD